MRSTILPVTEEEFFARYGPDDRVELVDGVVVPKYGFEGPMSPTGSGHGVIVSNLAFALEAHVRPQRLGRVFTDPSAFVISDEPRRLRCPDVAFVRRDRLPTLISMREALRLAPDLAAEVISLSEPASEVDAKIDEYLECGVRLVWKVDPKRRLVTAYDEDARMTRVRGDDVLTAEGVLPGFALTLAELFQDATA